MAKKETDKKKEFSKEQVCMVGKCQVIECGKVAALAKVRPRAAVVSAGGEVQICRECYDKFYPGCKIVLKNRKPNLLFKEGESRRVI